MNVIIGIVIALVAIWVLAVVVEGVAAFGGILYMIWPAVAGLVLAGVLAFKLYRATGNDDIAVVLFLVIIAPTVYAQHRWWRHLNHG